MKKMPRSLIATRRAADSDSVAPVSRKRCIPRWPSAPPKGGRYPEMHLIIVAINRLRLVDHGRTSCRPMKRQKGAERGQHACNGFLWLLMRRRSTAGLNCSSDSVRATVGRRGPPFMLQTHARKACPISSMQCSHKLAASKCRRIHRDPLGFHLIVGGVGGC